MATIRKRGNRYHVQIRRKGHPAITRSFHHKADATAWARKLESDIERDTFVDATAASEILLSDVLERYENEILREAGQAPSWRSHMKVLHRHLGKRTLSSIRTRDIAGLRDIRLLTVSPQTVRHELGLLHRVFKKCTTEWAIHLPQGIPSVSPPRLPQGRTRRLYPGEEQRLLDALRSTPTVKAIVAFALESGMRRGEIAAMRWEHVNLRSRTLLIQHTKTRIPREIPLSANALRILREQPRHLSGQVFEIRPDSITQAFERACRRAGLAGLRFHDLRHEATSRFFEKGLSVMEVATITGHRDLRMLNRYTHLRAQDIAARL